MTTAPLPSVVRVRFHEKRRLRESGLIHSSSRAWREKLRRFGPKHARYEREKGRNTIGRNDSIFSTKKRKSSGSSTVISDRAPTELTTTSRRGGWGVGGLGGLEDAIRVEFTGPVFLLRHAYERNCLMTILVLPFT